MWVDGNKHKGLQRLTINIHTLFQEKVLDEVHIIFTDSSVQHTPYQTRHCTNNNNVNLMAPEYYKCVLFKQKNFAQTQTEIKYFSHYDIETK